MEEETPEYDWMEFVAEDKSFKLGVGTGCSSTIKVGQNAVVTFTVLDINVAKVELQKHHVMLLGDIIEIQGNVKMLMFADSDKNLFQLVKVL